MMWYPIEALELDEQGNFNRRGRYGPKNGELLGVIHSSDWLSNRAALEREGRSEVVSAAADYAEGLARGWSVEYQYVFMVPATKEVVDQAELFNASELDGYPPKYATIVDSGVLESIHGESNGRDTRMAKATVQLMADKYFKQDGAYGRALVAPATELGRLHAQHGDELFARSVRLFLGTHAGGVNAGLRDTLLGLQQRRDDGL